MGDRVLVTGGAGSVGRWVVRHLAEQGHEVTVASRTDHGEVEGMAQFMELDTSDAENCRRVVEGHNRVIHLSAFPAPGMVEGSDMFRVNCGGTYNLLEACVRHGVNHVAIASSINALGQKYGTAPFTVRYFPIDEDHPQVLSDPYSFSKQVTEEIAHNFWLQSGLSSVCLRIPAVMAPSDWSRQSMERQRETWGRDFTSDFWVMIDSRDSAIAFALASEPTYEGAHTCFVNDTVNVANLPARELAARWYPYVTDFRAPLEGAEAMVSPARFQALLGWEPKYSWRDLADGGEMP